MTEELRREIEDYIESPKVCTIALIDGNKPVAHSMYYVNMGLNLYLESDAVSQKTHILRANPSISLTIDEDYMDWREIKGIELQGRVRLIDVTPAPKIQELFHKKFPHINDMGGIPAHHVFLEVTPEKIYYMDFTKKFGHKSVYYPEDKKKRINW